MIRSTEHLETAVSLFASLRQANNIFSQFWVNFGRYNNKLIDWLHWKQWVFLPSPLINFLWGGPYVQDSTQYCLLSTSYLARLFEMFILVLIPQNCNCVCFGWLFPMRTLCDSYHKEFESHKRSILDISVKWTFNGLDSALGLRHIVWNWLTAKCQVGN